MTIQLIRKLVSQATAQVFRFQGQQRLRAENHPDIWHSDCARALHNLKKLCPKNPILRQFDWNRISGIRDLQRIIPIDAGAATVNRAEPVRNRGLAFAPLFSYLATWNRWNLFKNNWLVASSVYESSIRWAEIPRWFRFFCLSISEPHDNNWSGIYLDSQTLAQKQTQQILHDRDTTTNAPPALAILEISDSDFDNLSDLLSLAPPSVKIIPYWVQDHQPLALWDQEHSAFRPLALGQSLLELTDAFNPMAAEKITMPTAPLHQEMQLAWSNPQSGISMPLRPKISVVSKAPLLFQPANKSGLRTPTFPKWHFSLPLPTLSHPQKSGNGAKPAKIPSHTPW